MILAIAIFCALGLAWLVPRILAGRVVAPITLAGVVAITGLALATQTPTPSTGNPTILEIANDPSLVRLPNERRPGGG
jgi:hypothetical protein